MRQRGFTVLELIVAVVFLLIAGTIFFVQKHNIEVADRDSARKVAVNEMYYNLEDVYYPAHGGYPQHLTTDVLKGIDPNILKDPNGLAVGDYGSDYRYEPKNCDAADKCASYTLTANLQNEADYVKDSRNK